MREIGCEVGDLFGLGDPFSGMLAGSCRVCNMAGMEVDFEVYKALRMYREIETTTYNDVLRELLGLPPRNECRLPGESRWRVIAALR